MEKYYNSQALSQESIAVLQQEYMTKVYGWMAGGMVTTALVSWYLMDSGLNVELGGLYWVFALATLGIVFFLSAKVNTMKASTAKVLFFTFSGLIGITLSMILPYYTTDAISTTFFVTTGTFGIMAYWGHTTKKDLTGMGRFMFMGLIGIILSSIVNIFIGSSALMWAVTTIGILVFSGLTAYDSQRIKEEYVLMAEGNEIAQKSAILGALSLYLNFINLFLMLLRVIGGGRD